MKSIVYTKHYDAPEIDQKAIMRYAGIRAEIPELCEKIGECVAEAKDIFSYSVCYARFDIVRRCDVLDLGFCETDNRRLLEYFEGCDGLILFGATVGLAADRLISRYSATSPAKALLIQAFATERIESLCDSFEGETAALLREEALFLKPRFSPGYGGVPLELQKDIFAALDCPRKIGLSLNESLLMSPSKSVTAFMGITKQSVKKDI